MAVFLDDVMIDLMLQHELYGKATWGHHYCSFITEGKGYRISYEEFERFFIGREFLEYTDRTVRAIFRKNTLMQKGNMAYFILNGQTEQQSIFLASLDLKLARSLKGKWYQTVTFDAEELYDFLDAHIENQKHTTT